MAIPFVITEGTTILVDSNGNLARIHNQDNSLRVGKISRVIADQSTDTPLLANGKFNDSGPFSEILDASEISVAIHTDQDGLNDGVNGLKVQWSQNGVDVDKENTFNVQANIGKNYTFGVSYRYVRVVMQNGPSDQGFLRLQTISSPFRTKPSSHRVDDMIVDDDDAELTKAISTGKDPDGLYQNSPVCGPVSVQSSNTPLDANSTFNGDIAKTRNWTGLLVVIVSDVPSDSDGLRIEWFMDEAGNYSLGEDVFTYDSESINKKRSFQLPIQGNYAKVTYINGSTAQSNFIIHSYLCDEPPESLVSALTTPLNENLLAQLVRSVITGRDDSGTYRNVSVDSQGNIQMALAPGGKIIPTLGTNLFYDDMNPSNGGISRGTVVTNDVWTRIYSYSGGGGLLLGIRVTLESLISAGKNWWVRLVVDGVEVFGPSGFDMVDVGTITRYGWAADASKLVQTWGGINLANNTFLWDSPNDKPITYNSSVEVYVMHTGDNRKFLAGLTCIVKD